MSTPPKPKDLTTPVIIATGILLAGGICAYYYLSKHSKTTTRATQANLQALEAQVRDLKHAVAVLEANQAKAEPRIASPAAAADPATTAQLNALAAALTAMAESQKAQQATLAQLAAKPAAVAVAPTPPPATVAAPVTAPPAPPVASTPPTPKPAAATIDSVQAAYKQAWETSQPVTLGKILNTQTGKLEGGRTLDPAQAKVLGMASWQEWYATEEQARRAGLEEQAASERERTENTLVELPRQPAR